MRGSTSALGFRFPERRGNGNKSWFGSESSINMAVRNRALLLVFVLVIAASSCTGASDLARPDGLHGRKFLFQLVEGKKISADYGPPVGNPPLHQDPPTPATFKSLELRDWHTSARDVDIHVDYLHPGTHPPNDYHNYPPPASWRSKMRNVHADYAPAVTHPPDYYDYPPPSSMKL